MKYNNFDITKIYYSGHTITSAYGCGGYKVFDSEEPPTPPTPTGGTKFSAVYLGGETYSTECDGNTTLTSGNTKPSGYEYSAMTEATIGSCVTAIGDRTFSSCKSLSSITIPYSVTSIGNNAFGWCSSLTSVTIPDSVTSIGDSAFQFCNSLTSVTIPSGVTTIGKGALFYCSGLQRIIVEALVPPSLGIGAFTGSTCPIYVPCQSLEAYKTAWSDYASRIQCISPSFDGKFKAEYSGGTSYSADCDGSTDLTTATTRPSGYEYSAMTSAVIGDCNISIDRGAFWSCESLSSITIPNSITSIGQNAFYGCISLTGITIPSGVTTIGQNAFSFCYDLAGNLDIPDSVTSIGDNAFEDCRSLTSVTIGSGITTINHSAFVGCSGLTEIIIPDTVTSIGNQAFDRCSGTTTLTIGSGVTSIGDYAFGDCDNLTNITINAITPPTNGIQIFGNTSVCPIYVPSESLEAYKTAWSGYANRIVPIE